MDGNPAIRTATFFHVLFKQIGDEKRSGHSECCSIQVSGWKRGYLSVTARPMPAGVASIFSLLFGLAAAGFTEFQGGRAGFPVADSAVGLLVFFTAGAGVFINAPASGGDWFLGAGCWFWHCITLALLCYNYSYAHKSFKLSYPSGTLPGVRHGEAGTFAGHLLDQRMTCRSAADTLVSGKITKKKKNLVGGRSCLPCGDDQ